MDYLWKFLIALIGYILGGLTVHLCYQYNIQKNSTKQSNKNGNNNIASGGGVIANDYHPTTSITVEAVPAQTIPEPSEQAKSIIKQLVDNNGERLVSFEELGIVQELLIPNTNITIIISDKLSVKEDLTILEKNGYISASIQNATGFIYVLTPTAREYGKELLASENNGNTVK